MYNITVLNNGEITYLKYDRVEEKDNMLLYLLGRYVVLAIQIQTAEPTVGPED